MIILQKQHHQMQETRNNCFEWRKLRTTLKRKQVNPSELLLYFGTGFRLTKGRVTFFFQPETIVESFLHLMMLFCKVIINHNHFKGFSSSFKNRANVKSEKHIEMNDTLLSNFSLTTASKLVRQSAKKAEL